MEDELITFSTAKLAKDKGFDVETVNQWWYALQEDGDVDLQDHDNYTRKEAFLAPTQSLLQKWLREVRGLNLYISLSGPKQISWYWSINDKKHQLGSSKTYEQALEGGLLEALKLIKI